jgi:hypothetical protein
MNNLLSAGAALEINDLRRASIAGAGADPAGTGSSISDLNSSVGLAARPSASAGTEAVGIDTQHLDADRDVIQHSDVEPLAVRSKADTWRTALHEAGHCVVGRVLGEEVGGCTIVAGPDYGGLTWGPSGNSARLSWADDEPDLCEKIGALMPGPGESRTDAAEIFAHVQVRITDLCAGTAAESLLHPDDDPWIAHSDIRQARALASLICSSEFAIDAYLMFGLAEAKALISEHRAAVLAIANALMIHRTLDAVMIHEIIARAPERARRAAWNIVEKNAADFAARGLEG